jgi:hypothetical protein
VQIHWNAITSSTALLNQTCPVIELDDHRRWTRGSSFCATASFLSHPWYPLRPVRHGMVAGDSVSLETIAAATGNSQRGYTLTKGRNAVRRVQNTLLAVRCSRSEFFDDLQAKGHELGLSRQ